MCFCNALHLSVFVDDVAKERQRSNDKRWVHHGSPPQKECRSQKALEPRPRWRCNTFLYSPPIWLNLRLHCAVVYVFRKTSQQHQKAVFTGFKAMYASTSGNFAVAAVFAFDRTIARTPTPIASMGEPLHYTWLVMDCIKLNIEEYLTDGSTGSFCCIRSSFLFSINAANLWLCATLLGCFPDSVMSRCSPCCVLSLIYGPPWNQPLLTRHLSI